MKNLTTRFFSIVAACAIATVSCQEDSLKYSRTDISFKVNGFNSMNDTKSSIEETITLKSIDGQGPSLQICASPYETNSREATKGSIATTSNLSQFFIDAIAEGASDKYMDGVAANLNAGKWMVDKDKEGNSYKWLNELDLAFWAHAPKLDEIQGGLDITGISDDALSFNYAYEAFEKSDSYPYTQDLIFAYCKQHTGTVSLTFDHALAAVGAFASPDLDEGIKILACDFTGIYTRGTCVYTPGNSQESRFSWSGELSDPDDKGVRNRKGQYFAAIGNDSQCLSQSNLHFVVPQELDSESIITITIDNNGEEEEHSYSLGGMSWKAGYKYLYRLSYEAPVLDATLLSGSDFKEKIDNLVNSEPVIDNVIFKTESPLEDYAGLPYVEVQAADSKGKIYAIYDESTKTLTVATPVVNMYSASYAGHMFKGYKSVYNDRSGCFGLVKSIDLGPLNTSKSTDFTAMFDDCRSLKYLNIANMDTSSGGKFAYMFRHLDALESLDVTHFDMSKATSLYCMFSYCYALSVLDVSNFQTQNVTNFGNLFMNCRGLTDIDISNFDFSSAKDLDQMFMNCTNLKKITFPENDRLNTSSVTDMSSMFKYCTSLTELDLSGFNTGMVTTMDSMFADCQKLKSLDLSGFNNTKLTNVSRMFTDCYELENLNLNGFTTPLVTDMSKLFMNCYKLTQLDLSSFNTSAVTDMSAMIANCESLTSLDVSNFDTANVTDMNKMFTYCPSLESLNLENFDTRKVTNMEEMFSNCSVISEINLDNFNTAEVTNMNGMFKNDFNLGKITLGENFQIPSNVTNMMYLSGRDVDEPKVACTDEAWAILSSKTALYDKWIHIYL